MKDERKTKKQLILELDELRREVAELREAEVERVQAEEASRAYEEKFRHFFENVPEYCYMVSPERVIMDINNAALKTLGYRKEEIVGKPLEMIYAPESRPKMKKIFEKWRKTGLLRDEEMVIITKDGDKRVILLSVGAVKDRDGKILQTVSIQRDITERKRVEKALRESEERYRNLFDGVPVGLNITAPDGQYLDANLALIEILGYPDRETLLATNVTDLYLNPEDRQRWQAMIEKKGIVRGFETQLRQYDGKVIWVESNAHAVRGDVGQVLFYEGSLEDITERVQAEQELQESEERFRTSVENLLDGFAIFSAVRDDASQIVDFRYVYINEAGCILNQRSRDEQIGHTLLELLPAHKITGLFDDYVQVVETGHPIARESLVYEDVFGGEQRLSRAFDFQVVKLGDGFAVDWRDVTARVRAEEVIRASEERYRTLFDGVPMGLNRTTPQDQILDANLALVDMLGYPDRESLLAINMTELYKDPEDRKRWQTLMEREGVVRGFRVQMHQQDGRIIWTESNAHAVRDTSGQVQYYEGSLVDITERKQADETIERLAKFPSENPNPVLRIGKDSTILYANSASLPLLDNWGVQISQYLSDEWREVILDVLSTGSRKEVEVEYEDRVISLTFAPVVEADYINVYGLDITERKLTEEALYRAMEETAHNQRLLLALSRATQAVQRARTTLEVYRIVGDEVVALGYQTAILTLTDDRSHMTISLSTFESTLLEIAERVSGLSVRDIRIPLKHDRFFQPIIAEGESRFCERTVDVVAKGFPMLGHQLLERLVVMLGIEQSIYSPLIVGGEMQDILVVFGNYLTEADVQAVTAFANQTAIALENTRLIEQVQTSRERLHFLTNRIVSAQEEERQRLSRELHDETGQSLVALKINLDLIASDLPVESQAIRKHINQAAVKTATIMEQVRSLAHALRPAALDAIGINLAMEDHCRAIEASTTLDIDYIGTSIPALTEEVKITFYRFLQEALTNVIKHAQANRVRVRLSRDGEEISLSVEDDGDGFDVQAMISYPPSSRGIGLIGMRERLELIGGWLEVDSQPGQGTHLVAHTHLEGKHLERRTRQ